MDVLQESQFSGADRSPAQEILVKMVGVPMYKDVMHV